MLYKLSFSKTSQGTLRVSAPSVPGTGHVLPIYDDDEAFVRLLKHTGFDEATISSLKSSAEPGFGPLNVPACCEEVELTETQLSVLRLGEAKDSTPEHYLKVSRIGV